nr:MAG TPA: GIY-YIG nuclease superfamily protein [Caudoviricetes sp.]
MENFKRNNAPFNPLDKKNLGESATRAMLQTKVEKLPPSEFYGAGIYAIYYTGNFPQYTEISKHNKNGLFGLPIYVGKAIPAGGRKGKIDYSIQDVSLYKRLCEHAESIKSASNLDINDFYCRYLVVDDIWIPLAETLLISMFSPLWNQVIDGFGNHDPGKGRYAQRPSPWDILHPGREWAKRLTGVVQNVDSIKSKINDYSESLRQK